MHGIEHINNGQALDKQIRWLINIVDGDDVAVGGVA